MCALLVAKGGDREQGSPRLKGDWMDSKHVGRCDVDNGSGEVLIGEVAAAGRRCRVERCVVDVHGNAVHLLGIVACILAG